VPRRPHHDEQRKRRFGAEHLVPLEGADDASHAGDPHDREHGTQVFIE
jgi:hypothetical protein